MVLCLTLFPISSVNILFPLTYQDKLGFAVVMSNAWNLISWSYVWLSYPTGLSSTWWLRDPAAFILWFCQLNTWPPQPLPKEDRAGGLPWMFWRARLDGGLHNFYLQPFDQISVTRSQPNWRQDWEIQSFGVLKNRKREQDWWTRLISATLFN